MSYVNLGRETSYSGSESYRYVEPLLRKSGELSIVSPYVGMGYIKMLSRISRRKRVRLITTRSRPNEDAIRYIEKVLRGYIGYVKASLFFAALSIISFLLGFYYPLLLCAIVAATLSFISYRSYKNRGSGNFQVRFAKNVFVHEKLYISSSRAITGSANLTYNGLHKNIEHIEVINSAERVKKLGEHFDELWSALA